MLFFIALIRESSEASQFFSRAWLYTYTFDTFDCPFTKGFIPSTDTFETPSRYLRLQTIPSSDFVVAKSLSIDELIQVQAGAGGMKPSGEKGLEVLEVSQIEVKVLEISE